MNNKIDDLNACQTLVLSFYSLLDEKRYAELGNLFGDTGTWNRLGVPLVGKREILATMESRDSWVTAHVVTNLSVEFTGADTAESQQYITLYRVEGVLDQSRPAAIQAPIAILRHRDKLVRTAEGWRIHEKKSRAMLANLDRVTHYPTAGGA